MKTLLKVINRIESEVDKIVRPVLLKIEAEFVVAFCFVASVVGFIGALIG